MVLALLGVAMLYYFWRTTGSPFRSPYQVYSSTYGFAPLLPWERLPAMPAYNNAQMRDFYSKVDLAGYLEAHQSPLCVLASRSADFAIFFLGPALCIPMLVVLWILLCAWGAGKFSRKSRLVILSTVVCFCLLLLPIYFQLHYAAPITCSLDRKS